MDSDELYAERLAAFVEKQLADLTLFAAREGRPADEVRRRVAEQHARWLLDGDAHARHSTVRSALVVASDALERLHAASGVHTLLVAADAEGFVGGTPAAREFWRGMRGGGVRGVEAMRAAVSSGRDGDEDADLGAGMEAGEGSREVAREGAKGRGPAYKLKTDVYASVRAALRTAAGSRTAEMKWTNHALLPTAYGVRLEGWPMDVPHANPSQLSAAQNAAVKNALESGSLRFIRVGDAVGEEEEGRREEGLLWEMVSMDAGGEGGGRGDRKRARLDDGS